MPGAAERQADAEQGEERGEAHGVGRKHALILKWPCAQKPERWPGEGARDGGEGEEPPLAIDHHSEAAAGQDEDVEKDRQGARRLRL